LIRLKAILAESRYIGRVQVRHDQQVGAALEPGVGENPLAYLRGDRGVRVHLALDLEVRLTFEQDLQRIAHFLCGGCAAGAEIGMRQQGCLRRQPEAAYHVGCHQRGLGNVFG
jgi:hypothetical protein